MGFVRVQDLGGGEYVQQEFHRLRGPLHLRAARFENCTFDNCAARGGVVRGVEVINATSWSCSLYDVVVEDCLVDGVKTSYGGGGRTMPFFLWGVLARRLVLKGMIGGFIWNPPQRPPDERHEQGAFDTAADYYAGVDDWALDVREARFRSVPSLHYGPPGHLVRRDEETQPLLSRAQAARALNADADLGIWRIVLDDFLRRGWPESVVLIPPAGAPKRKYGEVLSAAHRTRNAAGEP